MGMMGNGLSGNTRKIRQSNRRHSAGGARLWESLEDRVLFSTIVSLYGGNHGISQPNPGTSGISPPDLHAAVGPSDLLQFSDAQYTDLNLNTGIYTHVETPAQFWTRAGVSNATPYDTRAMYDPLTNSFFVVACSDANTQSNRLLIAVTAGSGADSGWYSFSFNVSSVQNGVSTYVDNLTMGMDMNGLYLATKNRAIGTGTYVNSSMFAVPIGPLLMYPSSPPLNRWTAIYPASADWFQPATNYSNNQGAVEYIVAPATVNGYTYLEISSISWSAGVASYGGASLCATNGQYSPPPNGTQPAGYPQLDAGGEIRIQNAVVANGSLWTIFTANVGGNASGVFTQTVLTSITTCAQVGWLHQTGVDYLYPSIAVNSAGWVTIGATEVSASIYPSVIMTGRRPTDPVNTLAPVAVGEGGAAGYTGATLPGTNIAKWGEYSSTFVDPSNNYTFWTLQEDSVSSSVANNWTSWFEKFGLGSNGLAATQPPKTIGPASVSDLNDPSWKKDLLSKALKRHAILRG